MDNSEGSSASPNGEPDTTQRNIAALDERADNTVFKYLETRSEELRNLEMLRIKVANHPMGDDHYKTRQRRADRADKKSRLFFYNLMRDIGEELADNTAAFESHMPLSPDNKILDMCMAPGGFLATALNKLPNATAVAFTLPRKAGGHQVFLDDYLREKVEERRIDITMLARDMGIDPIPQDHEEANKFLPQHLFPDQRFNLVICDGQVLRTHERPSYREGKEAMRLITTQLALGLEHLCLDGTMIILLHKLDSYETARLIWDFSIFSVVQIHKPQGEKAHRDRSTFYMVASHIESSHPVAVECIARWKAKWKAATFGPDEELLLLKQNELNDIDQLLDSFGPQLVSYGEVVWDVQARAMKSLVSKLDNKRKQAHKSSTVRSSWRH